MPAHFFKPLLKHGHIREILRREIAVNGTIGNQLPTENEPAEAQGVSREMVRLALKGLESEGLIARQQGRGTFVAALPEERERTRITGEVSDMPDNTVPVVIDSGPDLAPSEARRLGKRVEDILRIRRLRLIDDLPLAVHDAYLSNELRRILDKIDLTRSSMKEEPKRVLEAPLIEAEHQIDAVAADRTIASLLQIPIGKPMLLLRRFYLNHNERISIFNSYYLTDIYYYSVRHNTTS